MSLLLAVLSIAGSALISLYATPHLFINTMRNQPYTELVDPAEYVAIKDKVEVINNVKYPSKYGENKMDIYYPKGNVEKLPTIIWTHGGSFIGGDKSSLRVFGSMVAEKGYTFVSLNYGLAPESVYPYPTRQFGEVVNYITTNNDKFFYVDPTSIIVGGDSAGGQIAAQYALSQTNEEIATAIEVVKKPDITNFKAALLFCGPYDLTELDKLFASDSLSPQAASTLETFINHIGWSYFGFKDWRTSPGVSETNIVNNATIDFPPTYITDGDTFSFESHAKKLYDKLSDLKVPVTMYLPSKNALEGQKFNHEYQFDFVNYHEQAMLNFNNTIDFLSIHK